jgi:type IV pilus assembly protein PilQ
MRVGAYEDKVRFVLDTAGNALPQHEVKPEGSSLVVSWSEPTKSEKAQAARTSSPKAPPRRTLPPAATVAEPRISVESVDFKAEGGKSVLTVALSGPAEVIKPEVKGKVVHFGIRDANISQALRRTIETFAFPSAVRRIIPYAVIEGGHQDVRFAAELKGDVPYELKGEGNRVVFSVENGRFDQPVPTGKEKVAVPAPAPSRDAAAAAARAEAPFRSAETAAPATKERRYTGEKISLIFDDANIRNILQLIGEVSNLNIIAGEEVKGTITLRLVDVPWDQALELIMETKGLGMVRDGNVVRVLPKEQIRAMRQAELAASKEERQLEALTTEVIPVSYSDLTSIAAPTKELLSERGKITSDARNKQLIVTDVPGVVKEIKKLVRILDTPERQVMIEARIVEANSNFSRDVGVRWGISYTPDDSGSGDISRINVGLGGSFLIPPPGTGTVLGSAGMGTGLTFGRVGIDSTVLDLRISALETAGQGKVVSTPRVTTLNGGKALISQGTKIPYQSTSDKGTETKFENAELKLEVSPVINPDNSVILDIKASNSSVGATVPTGVGDAIAIDEKKAETKVLVKDGETTVIGGIFVEDERYSHAGVPWLMKVPILGHLFKSTTRTNERRELLVFITPRILN